MADVLLSLNDETEKMLREIAKEKYGGKKGSLSEAATEAISNFYSVSSEVRKLECKKQFFALLDKGVHLGLKGKKAYENRSEIYGSRFKNFD